MPKIRYVRSATAMRVVNLDRAKFNEAAADGFYKCAPATVKGSVREFSVEDDELIPLYFFARLLEFGIPARRAGQLACDAWAASRRSGAGEADRIIFLRGRLNSIFVPSVQEFPNGKIEAYDPDAAKRGAYRGIGPVLFTVEFFFSNVRKIIADAIAHEESILGEEEE